MIANRQPWFREYRRTGFLAEIQHQFPLTGAYAFSPSAVKPMKLLVSSLPKCLLCLLVTIGTNQTALVKITLLFTLVSNAVCFPSSEKTVAKAINRMAKSVPCTLNWPMKPFNEHFPPTDRSPFAKIQRPDAELLKELIKSTYSKSARVPGSGNEVHTSRRKIYNKNMAKMRDLRKENIAEKDQARGETRK